MVLFRQELGVEPELEQTLLVIRQQLEQNIANNQERLVKT